MSNQDSSSKPLALVLGAEGRGLSEVARCNSQPLSIPMSGAMESLCVSQAGAILLFLLGEGSPYAIEQLEGAIEPDEDLRW